MATLARTSQELFDHFNKPGENPSIHSVPDTEDSVERKVYLWAEKDWRLEGNTEKGARVSIPMKAGKFMLTFPTGSRNLALVVIDPDPGPGE